MFTFCIVFFFVFFSFILFSVKFIIVVVIVILIQASVVIIYELFLFAFFYIFNCTYAKTKPNTSAKSKCPQKTQWSLAFFFRKNNRKSRCLAKTTSLAAIVKCFDRGYESVVNWSDNTCTKCINVALCVCVCVYIKCGCVCVSMFCGCCAEFVGAFNSYCLV